MNDSKVKYLKRYEKERVKKRKNEIKSNFSIVDDDVNFISVQGKGEECDDDSDEAPLVAEVCDESLIKWQPLSITDELQNKNSFRAISSLTKKTETNSKKFYSFHKKSKNLQISYADAEKDLSPPRRAIQLRGSQDDNQHIIHREVSDESSPRRRLNPGKQGPHKAIFPEEKMDLSPPRRTRNYLSPPLRPSNDFNPPQRGQHSNKHECVDKTVKILGKPEKKFYRDRRDLDEVIQIKDAERRIEDEKFMEWGRGVAQNKGSIKKVQDEEYEMSKPLARYVDDEDLEKMLKGRQREGDPFLLFCKKKKDVIYSRAKKEKPRYRGDSAPNRFGILPGYRWDGVNRSNGYEKAWFCQSSNSKALAEESYKWSVENM